MKLKASSIILLVFAAVLALCAAFVARSLLAPQAVEATQEAVAQENQAPDIFVAVAAKAVQPGQFIGATDLRWIRMKADEVPPAAYTAQNARDRAVAKNLLGATVRRDVNDGDILSEDMLLFPGNPGFIAAVLTPGKRAVSIPTSAVSSNSGLVSAGDWVDVILSLSKSSAEAMSEAQPGNTNTDTTGFTKLAAQIILENVRVLALNNNTESIAPATEPRTTETRRTQQTQTTRRTEYRTITLEVSPEDAKRLAVAKEVGDLQVALRGLREDQAQSVQAGKDVTHLQDATGVLGAARPASKTVMSYQGQTVVPLTF
mgnify:CR=1 FL=1